MQKEIRGEHHIVENMVIDGNGRAIGGNYVERTPRLRYIEREGERVLQQLYKLTPVPADHYDKPEPRFVWRDVVVEERG